MKHLLTAMFAIATTCLPTSAQTENPRGIYKMTFMTDKNGNKINSPYDQYKICTDSVTLTAGIYGNLFMINKNDKRILNYTGEKPDALNATACRIFDSNAKHFTLKWWNSSQGHVIFPKDSWCTEYYESDTFSKTGQLIFDALQSKAPATDKNNPLYGHWHIINIYDELPDVKAAVKEMSKKEVEKPYRGNDIVILTPKHLISTNGVWGYATSDGKTLSIKASNGNQTKTYKVYRISKDYIAIAKKRNQFTDYELWKRITDDVTPLSRIASAYVK